MTQAAEIKKQEPLRRSFLSKAISSLVGASAWGPQTVAETSQSPEEKNHADNSLETTRQEEHCSQCDAKSRT